MAWSSMDKSDGKGTMGFSVLHAMAAKGDVEGVSCCLDWDGVMSALQLNGFLPTIRR